MRSDLIFGFFKPPLDFGMLVAAGFAAHALRVSPTIAEMWPVLFSLPFLYFLTIVLGVAAFIVLVFAIAGLYALYQRTSVWSELFSVAVAVSAGFTIIIVAMFMQRAWFDSRFILFAAWGFGIVFVGAGRVFLRIARRVALNIFSIGTEGVILVGKESRRAVAAQAIGANTQTGLRVLDAYDDPDTGVLRHAIARHNPARIILADPELPRDTIHELAEFCEEHHIGFSFVPDIFGALSVRMDIHVLEGIPLIEIKRTPLDGWGKILKRTLDIAGASAGLLVLAPVFVLVGLMITAESRGPVFVRLLRVSRGREFSIIKFRSMIEGAERYKSLLASYNERGDGPLFKIHHDPRVTRTGALLRRGRFDELPQLWNVLKGEISLVGPRPHEPQEIANYERHHKKVLTIKSGITGLAQVSGAQDLPFEEEVTLDRYYIENWSLRKDIVILLKTAGMLFFDRSGH